MNAEILEQQLRSVEKRLTVIEDKYPIVDPKYLEQLAEVMKSYKVTKLSIGQIIIELPPKKES